MERAPHAVLEEPALLEALGECTGVRVLDLGCGDAALGPILESIELIEQWTAPGRETFLTDDLMQNATLYRLETLIETASRLPTELRDRHPQTRWRDVTDFRNRVSHGYLDLVWRVIQVDLPALERVFEQELDRESVS